MGVLETEFIKTMYFTPMAILYIRAISLDLGEDDILIVRLLGDLVDKTDPTSMVWQYGIVPMS